jgi:hypothetical protein
MPPRSRARPPPLKHRRVETSDVRLGTVSRPHCCARPPSAAQTSPFTETALLAVGVGSGTNREECLNPRGIGGTPRLSARSGCCEPIRGGAANRHLLTSNSLGGSVDRTEEVAGSSPASSILRSAGMWATPARIESPDIPGARAALQALAPEIAATAGDSGRAALGAGAALTRRHICSTVRTLVPRSAL